MNKDISLGRIPARIVSLFLSELSLLLSSGISLDESLCIIRGQKIDKKLTKAISNILVNLNKGLSAYESFNREVRYFSPMLIAFIKSGDESGNMAEILGEFSAYLSNDSKNKAKIRQAFIYPIILLLVTITVVGLIVTLVMPTFTESFASYEMVLPLSTRMLLAISAFFSEYGFIVIIVFLTIILLYLFMYNSKSYRLKLDTYNFKHLPLKRFRKLTMDYQISSLLYILRSGDIDIISSIGIIRESFTNTFIKKKLILIQKDLLDGLSLSDAFKRAGIFSNLLVSMIEVGEDSGFLVESLKKTSEYFANEYIYRLKKISTAIEPVLILIMAFIVGFVVFSVTIPMFDSVNYLY
ncbi:type II secretion system F family protein [Anaerococcus sp.]|uniref:type II secretion system F family protein n=1 Tax=Anaerococcus sp. TaxID=1872515 RepID=UPI0027B9AC3F|nr:type II secretion system F family protein [Anaerococcus sp.]